MKVHLEKKVKSHMKLKSNFARRSFSPCEESSRDDLLLSKNVNSGETTWPRKKFDKNPYYSNHSKTMKLNSRYGGSVYN